MITRDSSNKLCFDIYRKPTNTPIPIPADSFHPAQTKKLLFQSYIRRAVSYTSYMNIERREIDFIKNMALSNGYKNSFINKIIDNTLNRKV